ncbi:MAG: nucleotidyltransferase domain-containing protein [Nitrososphaeria archaeon]|nr:nucleotidyltransferase domain-containing protein [Nitrososphaeria archaeon]MDW8021525.1 nucleotidyltransferase domain-containing protein [Nitrososphaerota archaeon]
MEAIKQRERKRIEVIETAKKWASNLNFEASVILIGSYARGDFNRWSDVDILIISDVFKGNPIDRLRSIDPPPGFQVIPINVREFENLRERGDVLVKEALRHGVILRDDLKLYRIFADKHS